VSEQLAQGCHLKARGRESNSRPSDSQAQRPDHDDNKRNLKDCLLGDHASAGVAPEGDTVQYYTHNMRHFSNGDDSLLKTILKHIG